MKLNKSKIESSKMRDKANDFSIVFVDETGKKFKNSINKVLFLLPKLSILIFIISLIAIVVLFGGAYIVDEDDFKTGSNSSSSYTSKASYNPQNGKVSVSSKDFVNNKLLELGYSQSKIDSMTDEEKLNILGINGTNIDDYSSIDLLWETEGVYSKILDSKETLEYLVNAEIITQYPDFGEVGKDSINGIIKFNRVDDEGQTINLKYVSEETFKNYLKQYKNNRTDENKKNLISIFSLSEKGIIKIACIEREKVEIETNDTEITLEEIQKEYGENDKYNIKKSSDGKYYASIENIKEQEINYDNFISKYTMPFSYLWALTITVDDKGEFAKELAKFCYESDIVITINDSISTNYEENEIKYKKQTQTVTDAKIGISPEKDVKYESSPIEAWKEETPAGECSEFLVKYKKTKVTNSLVTGLTKADTWVTNFEASYNKIVQNVDKPMEGTSIDIEANGKYNTYETIEYSNDLKGNISGNEKLLENKNIKKLKEDAIDSINDNSITVDVIYAKQEKQVRYIEKSEVVYEYSTNVNYIKQNEQTKEAMVKDEKGNEVNKFVYAVKKCDNAMIYLHNSATKIDDWLFDYLESNEDTKNLIDVTKYFLNCLSNSNNYGEDLNNFDFNTFGEKKFNELGEITGNSAEEKVWSSLKKLGYSDIAVAGAMGNIYGESGFNPTLVEKATGEGIGLCQWSYGRKIKLIAYAESKGVEWKDIDTQIEFLIAEISGTGLANKYASKVTVGYIISEKISSTVGDWMNATSVEDSTLYFMRFFESPSDRSSYEKRKNQAKIYYEKYRNFSSSTLISNEGQSNVVFNTVTINEKKFRIFDQMWIHNNLPGKKSWNGLCNRGTAIIIASAYTNKTDMNLINDVDESCDWTSTGNNSNEVLLYDNASNKFFNKYGLKAETETRKNWNTNQYDYREQVKIILNSGGYVALHINCSDNPQFASSGHYLGKSGKAWASKNNYHWLCMLAYEYKDGKDMVFIADSAYQHPGWYGIDEFMVYGGAEIDDIVYITEK